MMTITAECRFEWSRKRLMISLGYLWMLIPTLLAAWAHLKYIPFLRKSFAVALEGAAPPYLTSLSLPAGPVIFALPVIVLILAIVALRFNFVGHSAIVGLVGSCLATFYLVYALSLTLPVITVFTTLCDADNRRYGNPTHLALEKAMHARPNGGD